MDAPGKTLAIVTGARPGRTGDTDAVPILPEEGVDNAAAPEAAGAAAGVKGALCERDVAPEDDGHSESVASVLVPKLREDGKDAIGVAEETAETVVGAVEDGKAVEEKVVAEVPLPVCVDDGHTDGVVSVLAPKLRDDETELVEVAKIEGVGK